MVEPRRRPGSPLIVLERSPLDIDARHRAAELKIDAQIAIQRCELLGDAPDAVSHEAVVAIEDRPGIHERQRERRIRFAQRDRAALRHRHPHVDLRMLGREIMVEQIGRASGNPEPHELGA